MPGIIDCHPQNHLVAKAVEHDGVDKYDWFAISIAQNAATLIAKMFKGIAYSDFCGTVQYDDKVKVAELSEHDEEFLRKNFPFISVSRPYNPAKEYAKRQAQLV